MTDPRQSTITASHYNGNSANALIHLYRGESYKMVSYRQRLDNTTNWAVVTTAGIASFAMGNDEHSHATFLFAMFLNFYFLRLEARRFRSYEIAHHRVRIMERFFYPAILGDHVDAGWHQFLLGELAKPRSPISVSEALGWRLKRNYLWIYAAVLMAWLAKLATSYPRNTPISLETFVDTARVGTLSGWVVLLGVAALYAYLISLAVNASRDYPMEDD
ncbi:DUF2270 domain-containing protein [Deinococcus radiophilus]|uniref:DUF2270 domain-containing protein n=1 Tax=Deinococcus radiophilus TaxID=32062 RepID=A0A3S0IAG7_9DEIO|nr:DUF2270 domain-containing protein [Deinococcus radiophilus]RTR28996.1 DUF2270 domain-containing protein [Deinococcus radiophilus]UFA49579.1 DUF2270 domain-containing protein [Deinococcus radiophilus]